ncbi:MAG: cellulase family glycosylhydrolase [Candidatus Shapirobacteria bacterium]|nr:cellulase family glycosylhydrolase [Candidatus Shapirobacteria bacterium]
MKKKFSFVFPLVLVFIFLCSPSPSHAQQGFGFNIHGLAKESEDFISCTLDWLGQNCNTTIVRLWGYQSTFSINGVNNLQKVLDAAPANIKFIVALEDFPFGPAVSNSGNWFSSGYRSQYRNYVQTIVNKYKNDDRILVWEIMNEPHCKGDSSCLGALYNFMYDMAGLIKSIDPSTHVSPGLMGGEIPWSEYNRINNIPAITATSCHYNADTNNVSTCLEATNYKGNVSFFYVGEAGYLGNANCSGGGCTNDDCTNCCDLASLQQRANQINQDRNTLLGSGANAFLVWQFSPPRNPLLICDRFSVFPSDPVCQGQQPFTCSPSSSRGMVISGSRNICADLEITKTDKQEATSTPITGGTSWGKKAVAATIILDDAKFPDFNRFQQSMSLGLNKLLPQELAQNISLAGDVELKFKHIPLSFNEDGTPVQEYSECEDLPRGPAQLSANLWGRLTSLRGLCGFLGTCDPVADFQFQLEETQYPGCDYIASCEPADRNLADKNLSIPEPEETTFSFLAWFKRIISYIEDLISRIGKKTTEDEVRVLVLSRSNLPGASVLADSSKFLQKSLFEETVELIRSRGGTQALNDDFDYTFALSPESNIQEQGRFYGIEPMWKNYCLHLCGSLPEGTIQTLGDQICPSCNPEDYKTPSRPIPKPDNLPDGCHWDPYVGGCDYYDCVVGETLSDGTICQRSCELDPICESGLCTRNKLYTKPYLPNGTYCPNKYCQPGECYWLHFRHPSSYYYPDQGLPESSYPWGPWYTKNPDVCTRGNNVGCNPDCCLGSRTEQYD